MLTRAKSRHSTARDLQRCVTAALLALYPLCSTGTFTIDALIELVAADSQDQSTRVMAAAPALTDEVAEALLLEDCARCHCTICHTMICRYSVSTDSGSQQPADTCS